MVILRIIGLIVLAVVALKLFFFAIGLIGLLMSFLGLLLLALALLWVVSKVLPGRKASLPDATSEGPQLYNVTGNVLLFEEKPDLLQITRADDTTAGTIAIPNGEKIKVVEEGENVLKIRLKSGLHKEKVAWVSKSDVTGYKN
ncbi:MAG: hypothetical protein K2Y39_07300 [Candidatus Obscuribacterales bacterium]|nr:hypothetical protein [Candidatus Obscuribacterales bacterium]